ncbi:MAG: DUF3575 domain-containing protein [Bacteroidota bacterium]
MNFAVKLDMHSLLIGTSGDVSFQYSFKGNMAVQLGLFYGPTPDTYWWSQGSIFSLTPEFRFYLSEAKSAPTGWYFAPYLRFKSTDKKEKFEWVGPTGPEHILNSIKTIGYGGGFVMGYQYVHRTGITIDGTLGGGRIGGYIEGTNDNNSLKYRQNQPFQGEMRLNLCVGYSF